LFTAYVAVLAVENHVDPAIVKLYVVVDPATVLAASYPDMPASDVCVTAVEPVHATESVSDGDDVKDVGYVMFATYVSAIATSIRITGKTPPSDGLVLSTSAVGFPYTPAFAD
jgi:hypothetical protein|tara:strand:- start:917 stop:1255 length:339 start_codon:yes stop_codon:yes gene_type:complete